MSLDFYLTAYTGAAEPPEVFWANMTHNVTPMWELAGCYDALYGSHGVAAGSLVSALETAAIEMRARPGEFRKLNARNGWGLYENALSFLERVLAACSEHPKAKVSISR